MQTSHVTLPVAEMNVPRERRVVASQRLLAEASIVLASSLDYEETLVRVAGLAVPQLGDHCGMYVLDDEGAIRQVGTAPTDAAAHLTAYASPRRLREAVESGRSHLDSNAGRAMIVPMIARDRTLGAIALFAVESSRRFGADDLAVAEDLARRAALAVDNARLVREAQAAEERVRRQAARLEALAEASRVFAAESLDLAATLKAVADQAAKVIGDVCIVRLLSGDGERLTAAALYHPDPDGLAVTRDLLASVDHRVDEGLNGQVFQTGRPVLIPDASPELLRPLVKPEYRQQLDHLGTHSLLIVPLRVRARVIGTLSVSRHMPGRPYQPEDQPFLQDLADRAALAIEHARLYRHAREAIHARDQFLAIAAHELRTPVAGLKGYAQLLQRWVGSDPTVSGRVLHASKTIGTVADRLATLTNDLLDVSRIRLGQLPLRRAIFDLGQLVRGVVARFQDQLLPGHTVTLDASDAECLVFADADRIEQVVTNLFDNAAKYSPSGGDIHVALVAADGGLKLTVRDAGIGLPAGAEETIFSPFGRAANAAEHHVSGMGLGLYIARNIVERHDGRIWARSDGEGLGTTLALWLPRHRSDGQALPIGSNSTSA